MNKKKFLVMGSAAAEGVPGYFCDCKLCRYAMEHGGKDLRMRTEYQLGDHVRIDFGPDNYAQELRYNIDSNQIKHIFITHSHIDHFVPDSLAYRRPGMSRVAEDNLLNIYGGTDTIKKLSDFFWTQFDFHGNYDFWRLKPNWLQHGSEVELPEEDMTFVALSADHMHENRLATPLIYMIRWGEKHILVANDTGYFSDETWQLIEERKWKFDLVMNDCTGGTFDIKAGHMSGRFVVDTKKRLENLGLIDSNTRYVINHFSHNCLSTHADLEKHFNPHGIEVGYDGMEIYL